MYNQTLFDAIVGPTMSLTEIAALGPLGTGWIDQFTTSEAYAWATFTYNGAPTVVGSAAQLNFSIDPLNYYDRALVYASWYKMSGHTNQAYYDRFLAHAQQHFTWYGAQDGNIQQWRQMNKGMALLYAATGDSAVLNALAKVGSHNNYSSNIFEGGKNTVTIYGASCPVAVSSNGFYQGDGMDPRTKARPLESYILNHMLGAPLIPTPGGEPAPSSWLAAAQAQLDVILATQDPTGSWREVVNPAWAQWTWYPGYPPGGAAGTLASLAQVPVRFPAKPFESALIHNAMFDYYDNIAKDPRIVTAITASLNYMETGGGAQAGNVGPLWRSAASAWEYVEFAGGVEGWAGPNGDINLNGMIVAGCAFLYRETGDTFWKARCEEASAQIRFVGPLTNTNSNNQKLLNQCYSSSYRIWPALYGASIPTPNPHKIRGKWRNN